MPTGGKPESAPLLPPGRHLRTLTELQILCLDNFGRPSTRDQIFAALELLIDDLTVWNIPCELWIDGSFLTEKHDPDDADLTVLIEDEVFNTLDSSLQDHLMLNIDQKNYHPKLHAFLLVTKPRGHPEFDVARRYEMEWAEWWQVSRDGWVKGLAVIRLGGSNV
jgi:hypothetical protein